MPSRRLIRICVAAAVGQAVLAVAIYGRAQQAPVQTYTVSMNQEPMRPQEDMEAICRRGESDLEKKEYSCGCEITCATTENGERYQIETPGCSTHCHALARRDPDTGAVIREGGCKCHPDTMANACEEAPEVK